MPILRYFRGPNKVSYRRPAHVSGVAQVLQKGRTIGFVESKLYDEEEALLASAMGTFRILAIERMKKSF
jgi:acyl-coenzyme A thioesterase PaaI-like protein